MSSDKGKPVPPDPRKLPPPKPVPEAKAVRAGKKDLIVAPKPNPN